MAVGAISGSPASGTLSLAEANELVAARLTQIVTKLSVRSLLIKGLALGYYGLRAGRSSTDVDLLVEPGRLSEVASVLETDGWLPRPETSPGTPVSLHSISLCNDRWPNDIDLHHEFPGLLVGPPLAFDVLWRHSHQIHLGGQECFAPDRASSIAIWALHSLRGATTQARHSTELREIVGEVLPRLSRVERQELADRIIELGADEPLREVPAFAELLGNRHGHQAPGSYTAWKAAVAQTHDVTPWLQVLRDARPTERPWLVLRALWPSAHDLRLTDERLVDTPLGRVQSRGRRAWRLVRRIVARRRQAH